MKLSEIRTEAEKVKTSARGVSLSPLEAVLVESAQTILALVEAVEETLIALDWKRGEYGPKGGFTWDTFIGHLQGVRCEVLAKLEAL